MHPQKRPSRLSLPTCSARLLLCLALLTLAAPFSAPAQNNAEQTHSPVRANTSETQGKAPPPAAEPRAATADSTQNKKVEALVRANRSETSEIPPQPDAPPTSGAYNKRVEDAFDGFPAQAAKREIKPRAVSENVAAQLAARMPHYTPPPEPKPQSEEEAATELADARNSDRPQNQILRLPDYVVREKKPHVFRERDLHSPSGLAALATARYLSETGQALNRFRLPLIGGGAQAYALARYEEDERLRNIRDLNDNARDLGQLSEAANAPASNAAPTWGGAASTAAPAPASRRASEAEAALRRLIRDTTSRRTTEAPSKLAQ